MGIDPARACFYIPPGLIRFKRHLFDRIGKTCGSVVKDHRDLVTLPGDAIPVVGCTVELRDIIDLWAAQGRPWVYWDRGYLRRIHWATAIEGTTYDSGYYRWHLNGYQMRGLADASPDRWEALKVRLHPWRPGGQHIVVAAPPVNYAAFHRLSDWTPRILEALRAVTDRKVVIRYKNDDRPLQQDLKGAHCLVTHGSITAIESAVLGTPVCVDPISAAAPIGITDIRDIETPIYPDREPWLWALAYNQWSEAEMNEGQHWHLIGEHDNGAQSSGHRLLEDRREPDPAAGQLYSQPVAD